MNEKNELKRLIGIMRKIISLLLDKEQLSYVETKIVLMLANDFIRDMLLGEYLKESQTKAPSSSEIRLDNEP